MRGPIEETRYELTVSASSADVLLALTDFRADAAADLAGDLTSAGVPHL